MKSSPTESPWIIYPPSLTGKTHLIVTEKQHGKEGRVIIATVEDQGSATLPNATLLASAPKLLAACKELVERLGDWMEIAEKHDRREADDLAIIAAHRAIAAAESK